MQLIESCLFSRINRFHDISRINEKYQDYNRKITVIKIYDIQLIKINNKTIKLVVEF